MNYPKPVNMPHVPRLGLPSNPVEADVSITADVSVPAVDPAGWIGKAAGGDFTTAYESATEIAVGALPDSSALTADDVLTIVQIDASGAVVATIGRSDHAMSVSTGILTVTGATFGASDTFIIYTNRLAPVSVDTTGLATEATLATQAADIASLEAKDFATETTQAAQAADIASLEAKDFATETTLAAIEAALGTLNAVDFATETTLAAMQALLSDANDHLTNIDGDLDSVNTTLTAIDGHVDGIEGALTTLNGKDFATQTTLASVLSAVDGIEALIGTSNTTLSAIDGHVDGIEGLLTTIDGRVDGIEGLIGTTNTTLTTIDGRVDGIEGLLTTIDGHIDGVETSLTNIESAVHTKDLVVGANDKGILMLGRRKDSLATITPAEGDYAEPLVDSQGSLWVRNSVNQITSYQKTRISTATTTTPKSGPGLFAGIVINTAVATGVITIYDNTAASGTVIAIITYGATLLSDPPFPAFYYANVSTGITIVTSAAFDITVLYN